MNGAFTAHFTRLSHSLQPEPMTKQLNASDIKKLKKVTLPDLIAKAVKRVNKFVRERDSKDGYFTCISCGKTYPVKKMNAGHYYSAGKYPALRFNVNNIHGQCGFYCNNMMSGNLLEYRKGLIKKIGEEGVNELDNIADYWKKNTWKWDRISLTEIIEKYEEWK